MLLVHNDACSVITVSLEGLRDSKAVFWHLVNRRNSLRKVWPTKLGMMIRITIHKCALKQWWNRLMMRSSPVNDEIYTRVENSHCMGHMAEADNLRQSWDFCPDWKSFALEEVAHTIFVSPKMERWNWGKERSSWCAENRFVIHLSWIHPVKHLQKLSFSIWANEIVEENVEEKDILKTICKNLKPLDKQFSPGCKRTPRCPWWSWTKV